MGELRKWVLECAGGLERRDKNERRGQEEGEEWRQTVTLDVGGGGRQSQAKHTHKEAVSSFCHRRKRFQFSSLSMFVQLSVCLSFFVFCLCKNERIRCLPNLSPASSWFPSPVVAGPQKGLQMFRRLQ